MRARRGALSGRSLCVRLGLDPRTTLGPEARFDLTGGRGEGNAHAGRVFVVELVALQCVQHNRSLALVLKVHKTEEELAALAGFFRNQTSVDKTGKGAEDVTDFALGGVVGDSL